MAKSSSSTAKSASKAARAVPEAMDPLATCTYASAALAGTNHPKAAGATVVLATSEPLRALGDVSLLPVEIQEAVELLASDEVGKAKVGEVSSSVVELSGKAHRVLLVGLGKGEKVSAEELRKAGGAALRAVAKAMVADVAVLLPAGLSVQGGAGEAVEGFLTGALLASFDFTHYVGTRRAKDAATRVAPKFHIVGAGKELAAALDRAKIVAESTNFSRTIASRPGNDINPVTLAALAGSLAKSTGLKLTVIDDKQAKQLGMGGLLGVGAGSPTPPRMIVLEHKPAGAKGAPLLVIGKSITFDTGGISIKPADKMFKMIYDKSGGCAVLGLMRALALLKTPVHVVGLLAAAENHVSGNSYRPGDVLTMHNGVTVEITNTDAEGRLVLGDAVSWGCQTYKPAAVVDLATLTGGCVVALGTTMAGLFANHDGLAAEVSAAGQRAGEKMWRLPVGDEQREMLKSDLADILNSAGRYASPLTGAAFISCFLPAGDPPPWVHLDIAGVADTEKELPYLGRGSTGYGVRTMLNWVESKATSVR